MDTDLRSKLRYFIEGKKNETAKLLSGLVSYNSTYGNEGEIQGFLYEHLLSKGIDARKEYITDKIRKSPYYTQVSNENTQEKRYNLWGKIGRSSGRSLILNAHTDIVPSNNGSNSYCRSEIENDIVKGRGACDDKGGVAAIILALESLNHFGVDLKGSVEYQFVIDEETGGNGTLAMIENGHAADCVIVGEPTELYLCPACRGAFWFEIVVKGRSVHMAEIDSGISAIDNAIEVIDILKGFEKVMVEKYGDHHLFRWHNRPSQVNIGMIRSGQIPSMVPDSAVIEGGVGFLPNCKMHDLMREFEDYIRQNVNAWLKDKISISFNKLKNEAYEEDVDLECVKTMGRCMEGNGLNGQPRGFIASCDARLFHHAGNMPCIVFGPGSIKDAHSEHERCSVADIIKAAEVLSSFIIEWCSQ